VQRFAAISLAFVALFGSRVAHGATWPEVEAVVRPALADTLSAAEIDRLLARDAVRRALVETLDGWDGRHDTLRVHLDAAGDLTVRASLGTRETHCTTTLHHAEGAVEPPVCRDEVETVARDLVLGRDLWRPRAKPAPRPPTAPAPPPEPEGPVDTLIRRVTLPPPDDALHGPEVTEALRAYTDFRDSLATRHWQDPFLPTDLTESGTALMEPTTFNPILESHASANLRNPFSPERLGALLEMPAPESQSLSRDVEEAPLILALSEECLLDWQAETRTTPPTLACFREVTQNARLEDGIFYKVKSLFQKIGLPLSLPILDQLVAIEMREVASHRAYNVIWAAVWLDFVNADPEARLANALGGLSEEERRLLRRRLWRWWIARDLAPYRDLVTRLYERHFLALYPEARDSAGLPRRGFFNDTWLWASNWLSEVGQRPASTITAAYARLGTRERRVIDAFVADDLVAERFPVACAQLRR